MTATPRARKQPQDSLSCIVPPPLATHRPPLVDTDSTAHASYLVPGAPKAPVRESPTAAEPLVIYSPGWRGPQERGTCAG